MAEIELPHGWDPRPYQAPLWSYLQAGGLRAVAAWHRRAGKDDVDLHWSAVAAHKRAATYWYLLPQAAQGRKAIWDAVNPHSGKRRIDEAFPPRLRETTRENEMFIALRCGSTWQVVGSDNYNRLVGSPPAGVVFSEWALADPQAWAYLRPILLENGGWALFNFTPRGKNHAAVMYEAARADPAWFAQRLTVADTGVFSSAQLEQERAELIRENGADLGEALFQQEYYCSFAAAIVGAYYAREMAAAERDKRIARVPWEPALPVHTAWDLGIGDSTAIWFAQVSGHETRLIDYLENSGVGLDWYASRLKERPYVYGEHLLPHDAEVKELGSGRSRVETLASLGIRARVLAQRPKPDSINAVRLLLPQCWFDAEKCARGIEALRNYRREWDDKRKTFHDRPQHDWASHGADAFAELAAGRPKNPSRAGFDRKIAYPSHGVA